MAGEDYRCSPCDLSYPDMTVAAAKVAILHVPATARRVMEQIPVALWRTRPLQGGWSAVEYLCHVRDVYATFTIRLHRARTEDCPVLEPMLNDLRARRFGYNERAVDAVLDDLSANVSGFLAEIERCQPEAWGRTVRRLPGEERSARWLVRQAWHEGVHHLADIRATGAAVEAAE